MIDYFVVMFAKEVEMLRLLIRSVVRFTSPATCNSIHIAINEAGESYFTTRLDVERIIRDEAAESDLKFKIVDFDPLRNRTAYTFRGWRSQQALKLLSYRFCEMDNIVVLDAKNFAIRDVLIGDFVSEHDKPFVHSLIYKPDNKFHELAGHSLSFFGVEHDHIADIKAFPSITPAVLRRDCLAGVSDYIEETTGLPLMDAFMAHEALKHTTEFLLYNAYLEKNGGIYKWYSERGPMTHTFFGTSPRDELGISNTYKLLYRDGSVKFSGMHRRRLARLEGNELARFREFLAWSRLIETEDAFLAFIASSREISS